MLGAAVGLAVWGADFEASLLPESTLEVALLPVPFAWFMAETAA